jgi:hypothetical protein
MGLPFAVIEKFSPLFETDKARLALAMQLPL